MDTDKSITEEFLNRVKDFIEMELRSCFMQVFTPEYIARNMQISIEDAKEGHFVYSKKEYKDEVLKSHMAILQVFVLASMGKEKTMI